MKEIDKLIERQGNTYELLHRWVSSGSSEQRFYSAIMKEAYKDGANFMLSHLKNENRWRKVEEEFPSLLTDVLIKDSFGKIDIGCLYDGGIWGMTPPTDRKIIEWKPID